MVTLPVIAHTRYRRKKHRWSCRVRNAKKVGKVAAPGLETIALHRAILRIVLIVSKMLYCFYVIVIWSDALCDVHVGSKKVTLYRMQMHQ